MSPRRKRGARTKPTKRRGSPLIDALTALEMALGRVWCRRDERLPPGVGDLWHLVSGAAIAGRRGGDDAALDALARAGKAGAS